MQENPLVSIVIPVYNGSNYMREAIDSALAQTYPNIEILVVNDGSTDDTREIALSYGDKIRYYEKENGGVSTALNLAIDNMRGEYFSWLSHDDVYYPDKIQIEIDALRTAGDMSQVVYSDEDHLIMPDRQIRRQTMHHLFEEYGRTIFETGALLPAFGLVNGCTLLIPKSYFDIYGLFDEELKAVQDYKKWFEMFRGKKVIYIDKALVQSRLHPQQTTNTYGECENEGNRLYSWIMQSITSDDLLGSGIGLYHFFGAMISRLCQKRFQQATSIAIEKIRWEDEPGSAGMERCTFQKKIFNGCSMLYLYCAGTRARHAIHDIRSRGAIIEGISDSNPVKWGQIMGGVPCLPPEDIPIDASIIITKTCPQDVQTMLVARGYQNVILYDDLIGILLRTSIKKEYLLQTLGRKNI